MKLLHIDSSITGDKSISRQLTAGIVERLKAEQPGLEVTYYNLDTAPFAYLSSAAFTDPAEQENGARALKDFMEADIVVIGAPMYNFSVPAQLKGWIDRVAVSGKTFRYTANGPEGLMHGKQVIVASVRGGIYSGDLAPLDHQESYLRTVMGFMGITDVEFIRAEGVNMGPDIAAQAVAQAQSSIQTLGLN
ncbi:MAG: NAD(P)H-dependent oxidoreductase [Alphaproteobacteria bacterium]|nr:NAD(P)H-dependent oxidoreductase [Alphaproteobacteria bacterium]